MVLIHACQTTEPATHDRSPEDTASPASEVTETGLDLAAYRNSLSDLYATQNHDIPDHFMQAVDSTQASARDPFDGFRIQVVSTRNVQLADSLAKSFRIWSDTTIIGYSPKTYVFFKQPHYKVHVGDFSQRRRAIQFSRIVKNRFPDAWVVHDRINPYLIPADTADIHLKSSTSTSRVRSD
ncbi:MAG: SPOR domain-containing protein [Balneolaceae bacterium]|nr:SPOR domain-containing protein [Balneolaceae bacterium]